jgi:hypothetical protein
MPEVSFPTFKVTEPVLTAVGDDQKDVLDGG